MVTKTQEEFQRKLSVYLKMDPDQDGDGPAMEERVMKQMNRAYARLLVASGIADKCPCDVKV